MENQRIGTIRLSGEDSIRFANALFRPSEEDVERCNWHLNRINENVKIRRDADGREAEVKDLDLSFLNEILTEIQMDVEMTYSVKTFEEIYDSDERRFSEVTVVLKTDGYSSSGYNGYLSCAA